MSASGRPAAILLGCVATKRSVAAPARDLYDSPLWHGRRAYAEALHVPWYVFSALHGLVDPATVLKPYDVSMADLTAAERRAMGATVIAALEQRIGDLRGRTVEVHAGSRYVDAIRQPLADRGAWLAVPLAHLALGQQLQWYARTR